ncbi:MAG: hypothetical protein IPL40_07260 [Proteobacteria bacterium]|nr:hypothetical protein [Pseudomonadota bacterium]
MRIQQRAATGELPCWFAALLSFAVTSGCVRAGFQAGSAPAPIAGADGGSAAQDGHGDAQDGRSDAAPSPALSLLLRDPQTGRSGSVRSSTLEVAIGGDQGAARYCLTTSSNPAPTDGAALCPGGQGPSPGWWVTRPLTFQLPQQEGTHRVFLWIADAGGRIVGPSAQATVILDTVAPPAPALTLVGVDTGSALRTDTGQLDLTIDAVGDATAFCVLERATDDAAPAEPAADDPCFVAEPPTRLQLAAFGSRSLWVFARDEAWNVSATAGSAAISFADSGAALPPFTWIGRAGDALFSNPENWSTRVVPGDAHVARFDASCGTRCDCTIDKPNGLRGLELAATYRGTVTQGAGQVLTIGASGLVIAGGTLRGSDGPIDVNGNVTLSGGRFESTSATLSIGITTSANNTGGLTVSGGGVFVAGTGTLRFDGAKGSGVMTDVARIDATSPLQLNRLELELRDPDTYYGSNGAVLRLGADTRVIVQTELLLHDGKLVGGAMELRGNLTTTCSPGGVCAEGGITPVLINGSGTQTYSGAGTAPLVVVDKVGSFEPAPSTTNYSFSGLKLVRGSFVTPTGTLRFHFDREYGLPAPHADEGFQLLGGSFVNRFSQLALDMWVGSDSHFNVLPIDVGTLDLPALSVNLDDYNVRSGLNGDFIGLAPTTLLRVAGRLTVSNGKLDGGRIEAGGDVSFFCYSEQTCAGGGTTQLVLTGAAPQTLYQALGSYAAELPGATLVVARAPSTVPLRVLSPLRLSAPGQGLQLSSGVVTTEGNALTVAGTLTLEAGTTLTLAGGALSYGALVNNGGTIVF